MQWVMVTEYGDMEEVAAKPDEGGEVFRSLPLTLWVREGFPPRVMGTTQYTTHDAGQVRLVADS